MFFSDFFATKCIYSLLFFLGGERGSFPTKVHLYVPVSLLVSTEVDLVRLER